MLTPIAELGVARALGALSVSAPEAASGYAPPVVDMAGPWWIGLIPFLPMLGLLLATACAIGGVKSKLPAWLTVGCLAASFAATVLAFFQLNGLPGGGAQVTVWWEWFGLAWGEGEGQRLSANFGFYMDNLTCLWMLFVTGLATMIALYASEYMSHDVGLGYCRFFAAFNLFVFSMSCLVMGDNLLLLFLGWEGVGLCSYLLIGYFYQKPAAVAAAKKAFIVNRIGDLGLVLGVLLTFVHFGTIEYAELFGSDKLVGYLAAIEAGNVDEVPLIAQMIPVLLMIGAFGKSAQLPLYVWLPDAMEGPTPVSALIHAATMVTAGVYLIARMFPVFLLSEWALPVVAWVGALTALLAATIGMAQFDIKRIMAYSTVSQLGYMFCGLAALTSVGGAFHVLTHAFFKATLFLACGAVMHGFAGQLDLRKLSGLSKVPGWRIVSIAMLVGCLNLAGFPFTAGYFSKDMILAESFITPGMAPIGWILLLTAGLTAYYTFRVFFRVFVGPVHYEPGDEHHGDDHGDDDHAHDGHGDGGFHPHAPGWAINLVLAVLAAASIAAAGLYFLGDKGGWVAGMIKDSTAYYPGFAAFTAEAVAHGGEEHAAHGTFLGMDPHKVMYYVSAVVGFVGIGIAAFLHGPKGLGGLLLGGRRRADVSRADGVAAKMGPIPAMAQGKWFVDEFYQFVVVGPLRFFALVFSLIDRLLVDGLVAMFGWLPRWIGGALRPSQSGVLHGYAVGMAGGVVVLLVILALMVFREPADPDADRRDAELIEFESSRVLDRGGPEWTTDADPVEAGAGADLAAQAAVEPPVMGSGS
ncbi:MAG: NADH-quinone oxidoreductase subunit L [Planctomycetota bacterium]